MAIDKKIYILYIVEPVETSLREKVPEVIWEKKNIVLEHFKIICQPF